MDQLFAETPRSAKPRYALGLNAESVARASRTSQRARRPPGSLPPAPARGTLGSDNHSRRGASSALERQPAAPLLTHESRLAMTTEIERQEQGGAPVARPPKTAKV